MFEKLFSKKKENLPAADATEQPAPLMVEEIPFELAIKGRQMVEITEPTVLARISMAVPALFSATASAKTAQLGSKVLYDAILPPGKTLVKSATMPGAFRGFFRGKQYIEGHAQLVQVDTKSAAAASAVSSVMNLGAMVVGQYYMAQLDQQLREINEGISRIAQFQDNQYQSNVYALLVEVQGLSRFQMEILEEEEQRKIQLARLDHLRLECTKLLGHANLSLQGIIEQPYNSFEEYEKALQEAQKWLGYQHSLMLMLTKMAELKFALSLGTISKEQCSIALPEYARSVQNIHNGLKEWHLVQQGKFSIDPEKKARKREGIEGAIFSVVAIFDGNAMFCPVREETLAAIAQQKEGFAVTEKLEEKDLFREEVQLIAREGKVYYLPAV